MKASDLHNAVQNFSELYLHSDLMSEVHFGCDCGCGGDSYTYEQWVRMCKYADEARDKFERICEELGVEWDYD